MSIIFTERYVEAKNLGTDAFKAYRKFVKECGLANGERWCWEVGESGDDSVCESWIGQEKTEAINQALRDRAGLKDGDTINIVFDW